MVFGLLPLFVPGNGKLRERFKYTRPAQRLLAAMIIVAVLVTPLLYKVHFLGDKQLADVTTLGELEPLSLAQIKLCVTPESRYGVEEPPVPRLEVEKYEPHTLGLGIFFVDGGEVPLHPDAIPILQRFVREHDYSVMRRAAIANAVGTYHKLWQPAEAIRLQQQWVQEGELFNPMILWTMIQLKWLIQAAPINDETRHLLATLSDETQYFIGDGATVRLAMAWARFGNAKQMNRFLDRAKEVYPDKYRQLELTPAKLATGEITGHIVMPGEETGIRVGLFRVNETPLQAAKRKRRDKSERQSQPFSANWITVTTSTVLSEDGHFHFKNLGSGEYYLALLVPRERLNGAEKIAGHHIPDVITLLSAQHPKRDLGEIRLVPE